LSGRIIAVPDLLFLSLANKSASPDICTNYYWITCPMNDEYNVPIVNE